jgi:zinc/manganese transport system substrate-binding protein
MKGAVRTSPLLVGSAGLFTALMCGLAASGCGGASVPAASSGSSSEGRKAKFEVVAAENFWGSIASQLGGSRADVTSIIVNPTTDPHNYEPTAHDARAIANAKMAIVNGIGYDNWAPKLLEASPLRGRVVLNVGALLGLHEGDDQHRWYHPSDVYTVIAQIVSDYDALDPADTAYFAQQKQLFETKALDRYNKLRREIHTRYAGVPVGYSESIFKGLGEDLGLKLMTPYGFARAVAEGTDVTAQDKQAVDSQAKGRKIKVWIFNSQNVTPDVQRVSQIVGEQHIPVATVTETLAPPTASFEQWQVSELEGLMRALRRASGR